MAGFESTMLHKVAPQPFGSQLPRESEALCRFRVDYRYWWPSPASRGESHEDSLQAGPPTIDLVGANKFGIKEKGNRDQFARPDRRSRSAPKIFGGKLLAWKRKKYLSFFQPIRDSVRLTCRKVGRALWDAADSRVNGIPWARVENKQEGARTDGMPRSWCLNFDSVRAG